MHQDDPEFGLRVLADETGDAGEAMSDRTEWKAPIVSQPVWNVALRQRAAPSLGTQLLVIDSVARH